MEANYKKAYVILRNKQEWDIGPSHPIYCCQQWLDGWVNDMRVPVTYCPWSRSYYIMVHKATVWTQGFFYCIDCKKEFPQDLSPKRDEILMSEYGINESEWATIRKPYNKLMLNMGIHDEFFSEEWWRKRGL